MHELRPANQTEEHYDPDGQVTRSSQNVTTNSKSTEANGAVLMAAPELYEHAAMSMASIYSRRPSLRSSPRSDSISPMPAGSPGLLRTMLRPKPEARAGRSRFHPFPAVPISAILTAPTFS